MNNLDRLIKILNDTKLYKLDENSIITAELSSYAIIIDDIYGQLEEILSYIFFTDNMESYAEYMYDHLFQIGNPDISSKERAKIYSKRLAISKSYYTIEDIKNAIESGGIKVSFIESPDTKELTIKIENDIGIFNTREGREKFINQYIPKYCKTRFIHLI